MIVAPTGVKEHIACGVTDMRKGIDGLAILVHEILHHALFPGHMFAFRGDKANLIKILYWDGTCLCLFTKRLEPRIFDWPTFGCTGETVSLTSAQLAMLIEGTDWRSPYRSWRPAVADRIHIPCLYRDSLVALAKTR